jgi:tetratricopeptide (TPR) repeat protein
LEFKAVITEYDAGNGNVRIANLAGHSYAFLGLIAQVQKKYGDALDLTTKAIDIVSPYYKSDYRISLGDIYVDICDIDSATKAYQDALGIAKTYGFADLVEKAIRKLETIKTIQCQP